MANFGKKKINAEINRICALAKETEFLITGVPLLDESGSTQVPFDILEKIMTQVTKKFPKITLMIVVAGSTKCQAIALLNHSSDSGTGDDPETASTAEEWLTHSLGSEGVNLSSTEVTNKQYSVGELECDSPLKTKDIIISTAFDFLRKKGLFTDEESEEDMPDFDWT